MTSVVAPREKSRIPEIAGVRFPICPMFWHEPDYAVDLSIGPVDLGYHPVTIRLNPLYMNGLGYSFSYLLSTADLRRMADALTEALTGREKRLSELMNRPVLSA